MEVISTYRFRLKTRSRQEQALTQWAGSCRFLWNRLWSIQKGRLDWGLPCLGYERLCNVIVNLKENHYPWLYNTPAQALQQVAKNLNRAINNAFDPEALQHFPTTKAKHHCTESFKIPQDFIWDRTAKKITIPKLGTLKYFSHSNVDKILGEAGEVIIAKDGQHWFVSIQVTSDRPQPKHPNQIIVGGDLGVKTFLQMSDGVQYLSIHSFRQMKAELADAQRELSRKKRFSENWEKQKAKVNGIHSKIARCRLDHVNKVSTLASKNQAHLVLEALKIVNMSASAAGTAWCPGVNVAAKSGLNLSILDQGWGMFRTKLAYKMIWRGGRLTLTPPAGTSQRCPKCEHQAKGNRKTRDTFCCLKCGFTAPADLVGSYNILSQGMSQLSEEGYKFEPWQLLGGKRGPDDTGTHPSRGDLYGSYKVIAPEPGILGL